MPAHSPSSHGLRSSSDPSSHDIPMWLDVVAAVCLIWYFFIIFVCSLGYTQLYFLPTQFNLPHILTKPPQTKILLLSARTINIQQFSLPLQNTAHNDHPSSQGPRTAPLRVPVGNLPPRLPIHASDNLPLRLLTR